jgi:two-component system response regulator DegU
VERVTKIYNVYYMGREESMRHEFKKKSRVLLIDDNYDHLNGIRELLNLEGTFDVVGIATNVTVGLNLIKKYQPDIVLLDMNMPDRDGLQGILEINKLDLGTKVLALSGYDDADLIFRAMKIGAKGYVLKTMASAQLIYAIDEVLNGKIYLPLALSSRFFEYFQQTFREETARKNAESDEENLLDALTQREEEVLELLTQGITYKGVASKLFISETTVKTHVNNIFQKLQVNDRTQAVLYAINNGFLTKKVKIAV